MVEQRTGPLADIGKRAAAVGLLAVIALSLALRLYGLNWDQGFDWTPHPDERAILMRVAELSPPALGNLGVLLDADKSPWNPRWFPYGSFPLYFLKGIQLIYGLLPVSDLTDLRFAGRLVSALTDVATVALVYVVGSAVYTRRVGLWASALVALAVIHIQLSHFFAVDTFLALFTVLTMYFLVRVAREGRTRDSALAGLFLGLGLATKVSLAPIIGAFAVAHLMYALGLADRRTEGRWAGFADRLSGSIAGLLTGGVVAAVAFLIVQPYALIDMGRFLGDVSEQSEMVRRIRDYPYTRQYVDTTPYLYQARQLATWGLGWPLGVLVWAALVHTAVRGLRRGFGLLYLAGGWALPMAVLIVSSSVIGVLAAWAIAIAALVVALPFRRRDARLDTLLLAWVGPYFFITGAFEVKFLRYMIPITPFLLLFGARLAADMWDRVRSADRTAVQRGIRAAVGLALVFVFAATAFYAVSYLGLYGKTHTAVAASTWINANVPKGSVVLKEHWEEGLPGMQDYRVRELALYEPDTPVKLRTVSSELARGDYLVLFSNRLYGTIPRLEERYPVTRQYYRLLFSGELGYGLVEHFTAYPELLGVEFVDETFERPGLPVPEGLATDGPGGLSLRLGFADESFSVYDHPKVLVFKNLSHLTQEVIYERVDQAAGGFPIAAVSPPQRVETPGRSLMLSPEDARTQQAGGTWTDIVRSDSWTNRAPALAWLLVVEGLAVLAFPLVFAVCRPLPDRGWLLAKALGPLFAGLVVWLLASLHWMAFSRASVSVGVLVVFALSVAVLFRQRSAVRSFVATHWRTIAIGEAVFLAAFFAFLLIRMANPDLWHPFRGGEKPMDLAYLNAVVRSTYMPPYDPWFAGGYLNYYYWGQFLVATMVHATGISTDVAFNLAVAWFFALTAGASFSLVYNLVESTRRRSGAAGESGAMSGRFWLSPVVAGLAGVLFVVVLGNLDGAVQLGEGAWRAVQGLPVGDFDFWRSSRMMPPDPPGHEITEFPFFTFLFADLHAHLMALPFTLVALVLAAAVVIGAYRRAGGERLWGLEVLGRLAILGVVVGALRVLNAWDYPTYLAIAVGAVAMAELLSHGGLGLGVVLRGGVKSAFVFGVGYLAFLPYHLSYEAFFNSVESTTNTTVLWQFLAISGFFVFILGSYYLWAVRGIVFAVGNAAGRWLSRLMDTVAAEGETIAAGGSVQVRVGQVLAMVGLALGMGYLITAVVSGAVGGTIVFASASVLLVAYVGIRALARGDAATPEVAFVSMAAGVAFMLVVGLDFIRVEGDIDRMNSVFKFYLQVWVLLAVAAAYLMWRLLSRRSGERDRPGRGWRQVWTAALLLLLASSAVYPVLGTRDRLRDRFDGNVTPLTLDGTAYIPGTTYRDPKGDVDLAADFEGIRWLRQNVKGSPVILEANTPTYRWGGRVSVYTGLPSVVGWRWHQQQQRWGYRSEVDRRIRDVKRIYDTTDASEAVSLLRKYNVKYVYFGQLERSYYPGGAAKFDGALAPYLEPVFESEAVTIYEVRPGQL